MQISIRKRLTIAFIGLAVGPLLLVGVVLAWQSFTNQIQQAINLQDEVAQRVATQVTAFFEELENELRVVSQVQGLLRLGRDKQRTVLSALLLYQDVFEELVLLNGEGQEQVRISRVDLAVTELNNRANAAEFVIPHESGQVYYSPTRFDEASGEPLMTIAVPLLDPRTGLIDGVLIAEVRIKKIWELIADIRVNQGQSVYIVNAQNEVVAHRNPSLVLKGTRFDLPDQDGIHPGLTGARAVLAVETIRLGQQELNIVAEQAVFEALALAINSMYVLAIVIVVALIVAGGLGLLIVRQIVSPVQAMAVTAQAISAGDLSQQVKVIRADELGVLAKAFNSMTVQLRGMIDSLEQQVISRTRRLESLATIGGQLSVTVEQTALLAEVINQIKDNFGYYHAHIYLLDDRRENLVVIEGTGEAGVEMKRSNHSIPLDAPTSLVARAARTGEIVRVDNVHEAEDWLPNPLLPDTYSEMAVPIIMEGQVIGILDVQENRIGGLNEDDANLLRSLTNQVAVALTNARLFEQTTQAKEAAEQAREAAEAANHTLEMQVWQTTGQAELSNKMRGGQDIPTLADSIMHQLCHYVRAQIGALYVVEEDSLRLVGCYAYSSKKTTQQFKFGEGLVGQAALEKQPMLVTDVPQNYITVRSGLGETVPRNIMLFPFMYENRVVGLIELGTLTEFTQPEIEFIQVALDNIAIAFNTAQARARIDDLLAQTQRQAKELQAQEEKLRVANEELEAQTESLRASESKLKEQQAELEATNTQLEEQAAALEESSQELKKQQAILDNQNQELKAAHQELTKQAKKLALANKYKSEFLANMSHELRTPLNSLLILARMLADNEEGNLTEDQVESAQIIYSGGKDLLTLINDILDLAKVESGKLTFTFEAMPLSDVRAMVQAQFTHVAEEKELELNITLAEDLPSSIETDPQRVKQIIKNLLSNAFKFTSQGNVSFTIQRPAAGVDLSQSGLDPSQAIAISVTDTGIGMTAEQQKIIFEAFQQAEGGTSRRYGGTGLGLSISRELATRLGGQIDVESEPDQGSTFTLYLPTHKPDDVPDVQAQTEQPTQTIHNQSTPDLTPVSPPSIGRPALQPAFPDDGAELKASDKLLLVIEDDPRFAKILSDFAHKKGFKCLIAADGKSGLELVQTYKPQAITLDLNLPDINGWEVLESLKNDPATRHIPVHVISADEEDLDAFRKGAIGYLTKPVSQEALTDSFQKIEDFNARQIKDLLLVENDDASRQNIKKLLGGSDLRITEADRGQTALELLQIQQFDCMILDLSLPDMSAFELLNQMNGHNPKARCPIIVYTGHNLTAEENLELMQFADRVIVKGVKSPERLLDETALFLHRVVAEMPEDKQRTIKQLYDKEAHLKDKKILIVDDDLRNSFALSKLLSDKGLIIKIAPDGQKALDLLAKEAVDLVLMDIMMPVMDGYETIRRIRTQPEFISMPILALTAKAMKGDQEKCLAAGANDYLSKPIDVDRLFSMLRVWLY